MHFCVSVGETKDMYQFDWQLSSHHESDPSQGKTLNNVFNSNNIASSITPDKISGILSRFPQHFIQKLFVDTEVIQYNDDYQIIY